MNYVSRIFLEINGQRLSCSDIEYGMDNGLDVAGVMNESNRAEAFFDGIVKFDYSATVPVPINELGLDIEEIAEERQIFQTTIVLESGRSIVFQTCRIATYRLKGSDGEKVEYSIEVKALDKA